MLVIKGTGLLGTVTWIQEKEQRRFYMVECKDTI
jgi:hypothetical protein